MCNAISAKLIDIITVGNILGEGVQWHVESKAVWWTDIEKSCLYSYTLATKKLKQYPVPERVACFSFIKDDSRLLVGFSSGFALYDLSTEKIDWLAKPEASINGNRLNDGRADRKGRFWAGTMIEHRYDKNQSAALYKINQQKSCATMLTNLEISNGLCWSPDGLTMYHADSKKQTIYQYDFEMELGSLSNKKVFSRSSKDSFPDGACIDSHGYLWSAQWGGGKVIRYDPEGSIDFELFIPTKQPSCVAIGGEDLDLLFVVSAKGGLESEQSQQQSCAGHLFIYQLLGVTGIQESQVIL